MLPVVVGMVGSGSLSAVAAMPAAADTPAKPKVIDTHGLPATKSAPQPKRHAEIPQGDFRNPPDLNGKSTHAPADPSKHSFDATTSKLESRGRHGDFYRNADGTHTAVIHTGPVNWVDGSGQWHPIDTTLVDQDAASWKNASGDTAFTFPKTTSTGAPLMSAAGAGWSIAFGQPAGAHPTAGAVKGSAVTYRGLLDGVDAKEQVTSTGVKELLSLAAPPAGGQAATFDFPLSVSGVTPSVAADGAIVFRTAAGAEVTAIPAAWAWDAKGDPSSLRNTVPVAVSLLGHSGSWTVRLSVDGAWLSDPARAYPVTIDPTLDAGHATTEYDAYGDSSAPGTNFNGGNQWNGSHYVDKAGYQVYASQQQYTYQYFDLSPLAGKDIISAQWRDFTLDGRSPYTFTMWRVGDPWSAGSVTWNTLPNHTGDRIDATGAINNFTYIGNDTLTSWVRNWTNGTWINRGVSLDTAGGNSWVAFAADEEGSTLSSAIFVTYNTPPPPSALTAPPDKATLVTSTPTLTGSTVSDQDGDTVSYWFRVGTGADAVSGQVVNSGWLGSPSWTIPAGVLIDGVDYHWTMYTYDGRDVTAATYVGTFHINTRMGGTPAPTDAVGPASVNLATGNVTVHAATPQVSTVGGGIGVSFTYNSKAAPAYGLTGHYWDGCAMPPTTPLSAVTAQPGLVRTDPVLSFNWNGASPGSSIAGTNYCVEWTGWITVPYAANNWYFGAESDDGVRIWVNGTLVTDRWQDGVFTTANGGAFTGTVPWSNVGASNDQVYPITIDFYQHGGGSLFDLQVAGPVNFPMPASWLSPDPAPLPQGWDMSGDGDLRLEYNQAIVTSNSVVLVEPSGATHSYTKSSTVASGTPGSWVPANDGDDIVTNDANNNIIVHGEDGVVYTFNSLGKLTAATMAADDLSPAAPTYSWGGATDRLNLVTDPVSQRSVRLTYAADRTQVQSPDCIVPSGYLYPVAGSLCRIDFWDGTTTNLYYNNGTVNTGGTLLARIENWYGNGNVSTDISDFTYNSAGLLWKIRDPLAADEVAVGARSDDDTVRTVISYDSANRVTGVTLPKALSTDTTQAGHTYNYDSSTQTSLHIAGLTEPNGYARRVQFDAAGRITNDYDTGGQLTKTYWDPNDGLIATITPDGFESTTVYDGVAATSTATTGPHRPTDSYGPAPSTCFNAGANVPNGTCTAPAPPHSTTSYDEGMIGLAGSYWSNVTTPTGSPNAHDTGAGDGTGAVNIGTSFVPPGMAGVSTWTAQYTGEVTIPQATTYTFRVYSNAGARLFVDDQLVVDNWRPASSPSSVSGTFANATANSRHRIRVDYFKTSTASPTLQMFWTPSGGAESLVPGANLTPRYGYVTSTVNADGKKNSTTFANAAYGLATAKTTDPNGLALTTQTSYETPLTVGQYLRPLTTTTPKSTVTTYSYYTGTGGPIAAACGASGAQGGFLKQSTEPTPASGTAIVRQFVYDARGRRVGTRVSTDANWRCASFDARGRTSSTTDSAGQTVHYDYSTPGAVTASFNDSAGTARTAVNKVDLLGRIYSYTDEQGTTTRTTYDQAGRITATYRTFAGGTETQLTSRSFDPNGRLASVTEYASGTGRTTTYAYDGSGRLTSATRPNGVTSTTAYDPNIGAVASLTHKNSGGTTLSQWVYTYSPGGKVAQEQAVTLGRTRNFVYDGAARLSSVSGDGATRNYAYDANSNRCATGTACDGTYVYDNADRLVSSPFASSYTYDSHGNLTSAVLLGQPPAGSINDSFSYDSATSTAPHTDAITVGQQGNVSANLGWTTTTPVTRTASASGSLAPSTGSNGLAVTPVDGQSNVKGSLSWTKGSHAVTTSYSPSVGAGSSNTVTVTPDATGTISGTLSWPSKTTGYSGSGSVGTAGTSYGPDIVASANGTISVTLTWPSATPNPDLDLSLVDSSTGSSVASSASLTGNSESVSYSVGGLGSYPSSHRYLVEVTAKTVGSTFSLSGSYPVTPTLGFELDNSSGGLVASSTLTSGQAQRTLSYANAAPGTYIFKTTSSDYSSTASLSETHWVQAYADVTLTLKSPTGTVVSQSRTTSGTASVNALTTSTNLGQYTWSVVNNSTDLSVPSYSLSTSSVTLADDVGTGSLAAGASASRSVTADAAGYAASTVNWTKGSHAVTASSSPSVGAGSSTTVSVTPDATGTISGTLSWPSKTTGYSGSGSVGTAGTSNGPDIVASANGTISVTLTWPSATPNPDLDLSLVDSSTGSSVASSASLTGNSESVSYSVGGLGSYPSSHRYLVEVTAKTVGSTFSLSGSYPVTPTLGFELDNSSGGLVASSTLTSGQAQRTLSYANAAPGTYTFKITSSDYSSTSSLSETHWVQAFADVTLQLKDSGGSLLAQARSTTGSTSLSATLAGAGTYTVVVIDNSGDLAVPSYTVTTTRPRQHPGVMNLALKNSTGQVVATGTGTNPLSLAASEPPGNYTVVSTPVSGSGSATLTGSYPNYANKEVITYDGNDHATSIDDGHQLVSETLSPTGRVLRRVVTDDVTGAVAEDTTFGYDNAGDSPAYSRPTAGGAVTTYVSDRWGLIVIDTGGVPSYPAVNAHGDMVGTTNAAGVFTAAPAADEFGKGQTPANRLGWLGDKMRFGVGGQLGLIRMGVRLYDPALGRFLEADPVSGGGLNDYDYVAQDPINNVDVGGTFHYTLNYDLGWSVMSPEQLMSYLVTNFNKVFPIPGAPDSIHEGQTISLFAYKLPFPVFVESIWSTGWKFGTQWYHPDYPGWISFHFSKTREGHLMLKVHGYVPDWSAGGLLGKRAYRLVAEHIWEGFAQNLRQLIGIVNFIYFLVSTPFFL